MREAHYSSCSRHFLSVFVAIKTESGSNGSGLERKAPLSEKTGLAQPCADLVERIAASLWRVQK